MDSSQLEVSFDVSYAGAQHPVSLSAASTVRELKQLLYDKTSVPPSRQKLMLKGLLKDDDATLNDARISDGAKVLLVGTKESDMEALKSVEETRARRTVIPAARPTDTSSRRPVNEFTFERLETLGEFEDRNAARNYLQRLKDDVGVQAVMRAHRWKVGALIELHPNEDASILGYNRNKGEVIALRLRTDDLTGFTHYPAVREVLMHELTHMVHSAHDQQFHALNRQLCKEVVDLDWSKRGKTLSTAPRYEGPSSQSSPPASAHGGGSSVLGGRNLNGDPLKPMREVLAEAAQLRLTKQEKEMDSRCGS